MPVHCYGWFFLHRSHLSSLHPSTTNKTAFWQVPKQLVLKDKWHFNQQIVKWSCLTKEKSVHHVQNISINPCVDWHEVTQYWFYLHNTVKPLSKKEHNKEKQDTMRSTKDRRLDIKISLRQTCCFYNCMSSGFVFFALALLFACLTFCAGNWFQDLLNCTSKCQYFKFMWWTRHSCSSTWGQKFRFMY